MIAFVVVQVCFAATHWNQNSRNCGRNQFGDEYEFEIGLFLVKRIKIKHLVQKLQVGLKEGIK